MSNPVLANFTAKVLKGLLFSILVFAGLILSVGSAGAEVTAEIGLNSGYTQNLLSDSSDIEDSYTSPKLTLYYYPAGQLELNGSIDYTYYGEIYDLSSSNIAGSGTYILANEQSSHSGYLTASYSRRSYRDGFEQFDISSASFTASTGYRISATGQVRAGMTVSSNAYVNSQIGDNRGLNFFAGLNTAFAGDNGLDIEAGIVLSRYNFLDTLADESSTDSTTDGNINSFFISPRVSRPLGPKTGINFTYTYRSFFGLDDDEVAYGASTSYLSPWSTIYEGSAFLVNLKTYLIPKLIVTGGFGYWDKTYLKTLEGTETSVSEARERTDDQTRLYVNIQWPMSTRSGRFFEPSLSLDYTDNSSSIDVYSYSGINVGMGLLFRL